MKAPALPELFLCKNFHKSNKKWMTFPAVA